MSGRSQFSSQLSRQKFFQNGPRFPQNGCKIIFSFNFLLACRLKMKNLIWAFAEARFEKHPLNHSLAHSLNFSSFFPNHMRYAGKNQLSGALYFTFPGGVWSEIWCSIFRDTFYSDWLITYAPFPLIYTAWSASLPCLLEVLKQHLIKKWVPIHEGVHIWKKKN